MSLSTPSQQELATTQANVAGALSTANLSRQLAEVKAELTMAMQQLSSGEGGGTNAATTVCRVFVGI